MSKTITIPTNCNPYVIVINNNVYTYKAGDTVEVPDEVAEAIEDALELVPKPKRYFSKFAQRVDGSLDRLDAKDLEGITKISHCAFYCCLNLTEVTIPDGITLIEDSAFDWCKALAKVSLPLTPPTLESVKAFGSIKADCVFYCKTQASKDAYLSATNWSTLAGTYSFVVEE